ncbi:hypothetical protein [Trichocoleus sp. FACHB-262]|uniref:hypothetical protein n=1 Tax=Trichocoleus sp. FACHB-262 TaxID=2692869 RepID=UPI0016859D1F|nr:hypothetical protein [Trichocoleus sp. FACHB-262]MBD2122299.1 hypothetical protein [Trichocoleus sp. FACHB-262]
MSRLSDRAFHILQTEIQNCASNDAAGQVQKEIVLRRLERLRSQMGVPVAEAELRQVISDIFPEFSHKAIKQALRANRPPGIWSKVKLVTVTTVGVVGGIYVLNLPFPMIRIPVAKVAPFLLFPSYLSMDHNYRQAISLVEQSDQLVNRATSSADISLGGEKVKLAQTHLDALPVWFLGYSPRTYCGFFQCGWRFTLDEFETARKSIGRMEAKVFQEQNAQTQLGASDKALNTAKQEYQQAKASAAKADAIADWQTAIDQLQQVPSSTLAGRMAQTKLVASQRDFEQVTGFAAGSARTDTLMNAGMQLALRAAQLGQNSPHQAAKWEQIVALWEDAVTQVEQASLADPGYVASRSLLADYKKNLAIVRIRLEAERDSAAALEAAQRTTRSFLASATRENFSTNRGYLLSELQGIRDQLGKVQPGTTAYAEAQALSQSAQKKLQQLQP